jgi:hypothetical protein
MGLHVREARAAFVLLVVAIAVVLIRIIQDMDKPSNHVTTDHAEKL